MPLGKRARSESPNLPRVSDWELFTLVSTLQQNHADIVVRLERMEALLAGNEKPGNERPAPTLTPTTIRKKEVVAIASRAVARLIHMLIRELSVEKKGSTSTSTSVHQDSLHIQGLLKIPVLGDLASRVDLEAWLKPRE